MRRFAVILSLLAATTAVRPAPTCGASPTLDASCPTRVIGIDPSLANTYGDTSLGEGIGQSFYAADTLIRSLTVWQHPLQNDWSGTGFELYIMKTHPDGSPDGDRVLSRTTFRRDGIGDGVHPMPFVFEFDPPLALPHPGVYGFMLFSCHAGWGDLLAVQADTVASRQIYPDGHLWVERARYVCRPRQRAQSVPGAHLIFRIVFQDSSTPGQIVLERARPEPCSVGLVWTDGGTGAPSATVLRRTSEVDWDSVGVAHANGLGRFAFEDTTVVPGTRYGYSLRVGECGYVGADYVTTPGGIVVRFDRVEATEGALRLGWSLDSPRALAATVYRRGVQIDSRNPVDESWHAVGAGEFGSTGRLVFDDVRTVGGARYHYRLGVPWCGQEASLGLALGAGAPCGVNVPVLISEPITCGVRLVWSARDGTRHTATLYRRAPAGDWTPLGIVRSDDYGRSHFEDLSGQAGEHVAYRLGASDCGGEYFSNELAVIVPGAVVTKAIAHAEPDRVRLSWSVTGAQGTPATIYRWSADTDWQILAQAEIDSTHQVLHVDTQVLPAIPLGGFRYRLGIIHCGSEALLGEVRVDVPDAPGPGPVPAPGLAITGVRPNPTEQDLVVSFSLPDGAPARFEVMDVAGRRILSRHVNGMGPGSHVLNLTSGRVLPSGTYMIRLSHAGQTRITRAMVIRQRAGRITGGF
jgi:hypothetical protein